MTFESTPPTYSSVNDPLVYVVYDAHAASPSTYPNYKYVIEVHINGTLRFTGKYYQNPTTNRGIVDIAPIVREYVTANLNPTSSNILAQTLGEGEFSVSVVVKVREEYSGTVSAILLTDSTRTFFNVVNGRINDFTFLGSYANKPASTRPVTINLPYSCSRYYIPYFATSTSSYNVVITGGTSTRTKSITPSAANTLQILNISPTAINNEYAGNFTSSTTSYTVAVGGVTYTINVICEGLYTNFFVHFMNRFGGYETMLLNKVNRKVYNLERKTYQQLPYRVDGSGVVSVKSGSIMHRTITQYSGNYKETLSVHTDWLSDAEYQWLSQLITSPQVWLEDSSTLYPVVMTRNNYEFKEHIVDGMININAEFDFGRTYKTQYQ